MNEQPWVQVNRINIPENPTTIKNLLQKQATVVLSRRKGILVDYSIVMPDTVNVMLFYFYSTPTIIENSKSQTKNIY